MVEETLMEMTKRLRLARSLSQEALAEAAGVHVSVVKHIETGRTRWPEKASAEHLADALGLDGEERTRFLTLTERPSKADEVAELRAEVAELRAMVERLSEDRRQRRHRGDD